MSKDKDFFSLLTSLGAQGGTKDPIWLFSHFLLSRNLFSYPFSSKLSKEKKGEMTHRVREAFCASPFLEDSSFFPSEKLGPMQQELLAEQTLLLDSFPKHLEGLLIDPSASFFVSFGGEDHLLFHALDRGMDWKNIWEKLFNIEGEIGKKHPFAYSSQFGYLTSNPSLSGTALTLKVILHLPALIHLEQIEEVLIKERIEGIKGRGLGGEQYIGDLLSISNQITLGLREDQILEKVHKMAFSLVNYEKLLQKEVQKSPPISLIDQIARSLALLQNSYQMEVKEAMKALSFLKLGVTLQWIEGVNEGKIEKLFFQVGRGYLTLSSKEKMEWEAVPRERALLLQKELKKGKFLLK
ncbi:MAG: hypothetical protein HYZ47_01625 [Simkania negevensis]|nr:hypothetical protein [Simkania negevensis]